MATGRQCGTFCFRIRVLTIEINLLGCTLAVHDRGLPGRWGFTSELESALRGVIFAQNELMARTRRLNQHPRAVIPRVAVMLELDL